MEKTSNKWPVIIGVILASLNLVFPGYPAILCLIDNGRDFCGEAWAGMVINTPTFQILAWPFIGRESSTIFFVILLISGIIQYFVIGYLIGKLFSIMYKYVRRLF